MALEAKPGIYRIDVPIADSQALFTKALLTIPHPPCYGELIFYAEGGERYLEDGTMNLIYTESGGSFNLWFIDPVVVDTKVVDAKESEYQNLNGKIADKLAERKACQIRLNMGLALRTNPLIYDDFRHNLLPQLQDANYLIYSADLRLPSEHLEKAYSESYMGNGLKLKTEADKASVCLTLSHRSNMEKKQISDLETWFANL